ncbi:MAG TPA: hypothetical protein PLL15_06125 [Syntrophales bacterium]|nr:hypothetical protein [Syntrophales bacterium]
MRDLTDTFHTAPVSLLPAAGGQVDLLAGLVPDGDLHGDLHVQEDRRETVERWIVSFNRDYLLEQGLVNANDLLLIGFEDRMIIKGRRFVVISIADKGLFRGVPILVRIKVAR